MAPERSLIPPQPPSTTQSHATVIGIVPQTIHNLLSTSSSLHGRIDQHSNGLSHLISNSDIYLWEHSIQTMNEELIAPPTCLKLTHPEYNYRGNNDTDDASNTLHVMTHSPKENTHHVYAASPEGLICLWIVHTKDFRGGSTHPNSHSPPLNNIIEMESCHVALSLKEQFQENEVVTSLSSYQDWVFASTSHGLLYKIRMTAVPLNMDGKLVNCTTASRGWMDTFSLSTMFTPKKSRVVMEGEGESIQAMVCYQEEMYAGGKSPQRNKVMKLPPECRVVSVTGELNLIEWRVSLANEDGGEGILKKKNLFERGRDGTLDLEWLGDGVGLEGYKNVELMSEPVAKDGSMVAVVRISCDDVHKTRVYVLRIALGGDDSLSIMDSVWLDRYAGESISDEGLECYGLVPGDADDGCLVYVGFGPRSKTAGKDSVTISAICFRSGEGNTRVKDLDLFHHIIPSVVSGCLSYDSTTGGCAFLASSGLLGGTTIRFPRAASLRGSVPGEKIMDNVGQDNVLSIKSHLVSAFRQFINKSRDGSGNSNHAAIARSVVPPSIDSCPPSVLSAAVVTASKDFLIGSGGTSGFLSPAFKTPSPIAALREKLELHTDFVNFLLYAGAYRKISTSARIELRDHGEMIEATEMCFVTCQKMVEKLDDGATNNARREEVSNIRHRFSAALEGVAGNVMDLPSRWASLQQTSMDNQDFFQITSVMICNGVGSACRYRTDTSSLYDIPAYDIASEPSLAPWTSSMEVLDVLRVQLESIDRYGQLFLENSNNNLEEDSTLLRVLVEDMSASLLNGHSDIVMRNVASDHACQQYENAKELCIPLLRQFANDNGDDRVALETCFKHKHFEGIVQICHDHRKNWMHRGPFSDKKPDKTYDIRLMLQHSSDSIHNLRDSVDFRSKLNFCSYVLRWYADKGMKSKVFELGKECPRELSQLIQSDSAFHESSWVNSIRCGAYDSARDNLLNNSSSGLWEKEASLSLAKLTDKLFSGARGEHDAQIDNGLNLIDAQRSLQEDDSDDENDVMSAEELIHLATRKINSGADIEEVKNFVICGLEVAATMSSNERSDYLAGAAAVWEATIHAEMPTWKSLMEECSKSVAGIPEHVLHKSKGTVFGLVSAKLAAVGDGKLLSTSYQTNPAVRERVKRAMGLDENMEKLFVSSAQVACK